MKSLKTQNKSRPHLHSWEATRDSHSLWSGFHWRSVLR